MFRKNNRVQTILLQIKKDLLHILPGVGIYLVYAVVFQHFFHTICPVMALTGFPCPGCGLTRAGLSVLCGRFHDAWYYHPGIYLWILLIVIWLVRRYLFPEKKKVLVFVLLIPTVTVTLFVYVWRLIYGFPWLQNRIFFPYF